MSCLCGSSKRSGTQPVRKEEIKMDVVKILNEVPLFRQLNDSRLQALSRKLKREEFPAGGYLMRVGEVGDKFFLIVSGSCQVLSAEGNKVADLQAKDFCGEQALIDSAGKRNASVKAVGKVVCWTCTKDTFEEILQKNITFVQRDAKRNAIYQKINLTDDDGKKANPAAEKTAEQKQWLKDKVKDNVMFMHLTDEQRGLVIDQMYKEQIPDKTDLIKQGDTNAQTFYVVEKGSFKVFVEKEYVSSIPRGGCFGELALMYKAPRAATVRADGDSLVWTVRRDAFRNAIAKNAKKQMTANTKLLQSMEIFQTCLAYELSLIETALTPETYKPQSTVVKQGERGDRFYIIKSGTALWYKLDETGKSSGKCTDFFGELALMGGSNERAATVVAGPSGLKTLEMTAENFKLLLGPMSKIMERKKRNEYDALDKQRNSVAEEEVEAKEEKVCALKDLKTIGILGKGAFGLVSLVVDPKTGRSYALKAIKKQQIVELGQQSHIINEKNVMQKMHSPFLVNLRGTYKDKLRVYFLLDVCLGGELFTILRRRRYFNEGTSKFYAGCVVEAFDYMHSKNIIYRDLKPENLVLDNKGYLKVTDFGFAKVVKDKTFTLCGTPDYLAPEIVTGQGHGKGVDWWTLGILIYEMLASFPPFFDDEPIETYRKIIKCRIKFPRYFTTEAKELIKSLLRAKATKRLGVIRGGAANIRKHPWFNGFSWDGLTSFSLTPPIVPTVRGIDDISNFDQAEDDNEELVAVDPNEDFDHDF